LTKPRKRVFLMKWTYRGQKLLEEWPWYINIIVFLVQTALERFVFDNLKIESIILTILNLQTVIINYSFNLNKLIVFFVTLIKGTKYGTIRKKLIIKSWFLSLELFKKWLSFSIWQTKVDLLHSNRTIRSVGLLKQWDWNL